MAETYASGDDLAAWLAGADPVADAVQLALAVEAASRAVDRACNRQFGSVTETRFYTAAFDRSIGQWVVDIDDVQTTDDLVVELDNDRDGVTEAVVTNYQLTPINPNGKPWTRVEILPGAAVKPNGIRHGVKITARWGWTEIPDAVKLATMIQASRLFARRDSSSGPLSSLKVDDVAYAWAATDLDTDVAATLASYRRVWAVA